MPLVKTSYKEYAGLKMAVIFSLNEMLDTDGTVAFFQVLSVSGQNEPPSIIPNYEGNPELNDIHEWLRKNNRTIPDYSSIIIEDNDAA